MQTKSWGLALGLLALTGCRGEVDSGADEAAHVATADDGGWRGSLVLRQLDATAKVTAVDVDFADGGWLRLHASPRASPLQVGGGGLVCTLHDRWRQIDPNRLGLLFRCKDGVDREVVLRSSAALPRPDAGLPWTANLSLESVGGEAAGSPWPWGRYAFALSTR